MHTRLTDPTDPVLPARRRLWSSLILAASFHESRQSQIPYAAHKLIFLLRLYRRRRSLTRVRYESPKSWLNPAESATGARAGTK
ncbi:hypothetical protein EVAR_45863_1 [Eumeta japonica]|uniref:Uncharacterized protein n=1 Tax=Eumeta variegata TaxID=151549 RepID=A0A4C1WLX1_EUMVA|nr:hypothetical protein EVAR_45863_1 [Eumeta japonica]